MNIKTKRMICLLVGIASVLTIVGTVSYAYFSTVGEFQNQTATLSTGIARVTFRDGDTEITGELSFGESITKKFTIENTGTVDANVKMYFKDLINTYGVGSLTYTLLQAETENGTYTEVVNKTDIPRSSRPSKKRLVDQLTIPVGKTYYYELVITLNYLPDVNQDADINARFSSTFEIEDINEPETPLPELMALPNSSYSEKLWAHRETVKRIIFETTETPRENAAYTYDLSTAQDGSIMSYLYQDTEDNTKYIAYIQSEEGIKANSNSSYLFYNFTNLEQIDNLYYLDTSSATTMKYMFSLCSKITSLDLSSWDTSNVTTMTHMFWRCRTATSLNVSNFDTSNVTEMTALFWDCNSLISLNLNNFDTSKVTNMNSMFNGCNKLISLNLSNFDTSKVISMREVFRDCSSLTSLDISNFNTSEVTTMYCMFYNCSSLTALDVSNFDTINVTNMYHMFYNCKGLTSLDVSNFDTSKVSDMSSMFSGCNNLLSLDVSNFDTSNVTTMPSMFSNCSSLTTLDLSNFSINKTNIARMFTNCKNLNNLNIKNWNVTNVTDSTNIFYKVPSTIQIEVSNSTMRQWVIDKSNDPKLTTSNFII